MNTKNIDTVKRVVAIQEKFKIKLAIGEDAYMSLRTVKNVREWWDMLSAAGSGAAVAKSTLIATTFFAPSGFLGLLGIGTAVTPVGWVVAAALACGGAWYGFQKIFNNVKGEIIDIVPKFINTPIDLIASSLFYFIVPMALKIADSDEEIHYTERDCIRNHMINDWGYDASFVDYGLRDIENRINEFELIDIATELAKYKKGNPDCNYDDMSKSIKCFLTDVMNADGIIDENEEKAIDLISGIFTELGYSKTQKTLNNLKIEFNEYLDVVMHKIKIRSIEVNIPNKN